MSITAKLFSFAQMDLNRFGIPWTQSILGGFLVPKPNTFSSIPQCFLESRSCVHVTCFTDSSSVNSSFMTVQFEGNGLLSRPVRESVTESVRGHALLHGALPVSQCRPHPKPDKGYEERGYSRTLSTSAS